MSIDKHIIRAENSYISLLEDFFSEKWGQTMLVSHDLSHHRRVWRYARELLMILNKESEVTDPEFISRLLIACYLHDLGMAVDQGERHGKQSRMFCEEFLKRNRLDAELYTHLLYTIEIHDYKEYEESNLVYDLHSLLSVADDLDAFGYTGICRYVEIYFKRGFLADEMAPLILRNAESRFNNFQRLFSGFPEIFEKHKQRYLILCHFFKSLSEETGY